MIVSRYLTNQDVLCLNIVVRDSSYRQIELGRIISSVFALLEGYWLDWIWSLAEHPISDSNSRSHAFDLLHCLRRKFNGPSAFRSCDGRACRLPLDYAAQRLRWGRYRAQAHNRFINSTQDTRGARHPKSRRQATRQSGAIGSFVILDHHALSPILVCDGSIIPNFS
jgi:hypothetical protein